VLDPAYVTFDPKISAKPDAIRLLRMAAFARLWSEVKYNFVYLVSVWKRLFQQQNPDLQREFKHLAGLWLVATACDSLRLLPDSGTTWKSVLRKTPASLGKEKAER